MTEKFKNKILEYINIENKELFYNSNGNKNAFKLFVRHISYAEKLGYGKIKFDYLLLSKDILIVDFDSETIELIPHENKIKIKKLIELD